MTMPSKVRNNWESVHGVELANIRFAEVHNNIQVVAYYYINKHQYSIGFLLTLQ